MYRGTPELIRNIDPYKVGVFRSAEADTYALAGKRAPYVVRSIDEQLRGRIGELATHEGGLLVVCGDPKSGKSRTLWEALGDKVPSRTLFALHTPFGTKPPTSEPFPTLLAARSAINGRQTVIWIDDAHEHFTRGLTYRGLEQLLSRYPGVIVAITVHRQPLELQKPTESGQLIEVDSDLLDCLRQESLPHQLDVELDDAELMRAHSRYPGLTERIGPKDFRQLPSWFAGVNLLRHRYIDNRASNPRGVAIAKALIDWRRAGMPAGMTTDEMYNLAGIELDSLAPNVRYTEGSYDEAFRWASAEIGPGAALIRPVQGTGHQLWQDFDAVTSWAPSVDGPLSDVCWEFVDERVTADNALGVGVAAHRAGRLALAERALCLAAEGPSGGEGSAEAMYNLGVVLAERGDPGGANEAERWWRRAADQGHADAELRLAVARPSEAERWWRRAAIRGDASAMQSLGLALAERDDPNSIAEAEQWLRRAANEGDTTAMFNLASLQARRGNLEEAEYWYRCAANLGHGAAMNNLGVLLRSSHRDQAGYWWRRGANQGNPNAMLNYARSIDFGYYAHRQADYWYGRAAIEGNNPLAMWELGRHHEARGQFETAETWYRSAAELGDPRSMARVGRLLKKRGDDAGAEEWFIKVAEDGNTDAVLDVVACDRKHAERWWRHAAEHGHPDSMHGLAALLWARGDDEGQAEAERWWRRAADWGHIAAMHNLATVLSARGDALSRAEAHRWTVRAFSGR
jgi:hypothetical protein